MMKNYLFDSFDPVLHIKVAIIISYIKHYNNSLKIGQTGYSLQIHVYHSLKAFMLQISI